ncbi:MULTISPECIES: hypothetical protein [unclassified Streptomyces]|uniref:hypothetical protein n=1 Tax=unclassified Streptomyces TaxID=2593676 RepID=UPI0036E6C8A7
MAGAAAATQTEGWATVVGTLLDIDAITAVLTNWPASARTADRAANVTPMAAASNRANRSQNSGVSPAPTILTPLPRVSLSSPTGTPIRGRVA